MIAALPADGTKTEISGPARITANRPLPHPSPDPISSSPLVSGSGAAAPPKMAQSFQCAAANQPSQQNGDLMRSKTFYIEEPQVSSNAQGENPVGSPSARDSSSVEYRPLGAALKDPGTKLASEHHGGKAGRLLHSRCRCGGQIQYDARSEPFCTACGMGLKNATRAPSPSPHERKRKYKNFRMYAGNDA